MTVMGTPQIRLANDIAAQFQHQPGELAAASIAAHIRSFWDPRMRAELLHWVDAGTVGIDPLVIDAAAFLRQSKSGEKGSGGGRGHLRLAERHRPKSRV